MDTLQSQGGEGIDPKLCAYIFPGGHGRAGEGCKVKATSTGYCPSHTKLLGLSQAATASAASASASESTETVGVDGEETAEESLSRQASSWLRSNRTQRALRKRWDEIVANGADTEVIRLMKELTDRVEGRAPEHRDPPKVVIPETLKEIEAMSVAERRTALAQLEALGV